MKYTDIVEAKKIYKKKQNVTEHLRKQYNVKNNSSEIIEIAYDLQAGSYIENTIKNRTNQEKTSALIASELNKFLLISQFYILYFLILMSNQHLHNKQRNFHQTFPHYEKFEL